MGSLLGFGLDCPVRDQDNDIGELVPSFRGDDVWIPALYSGECRMRRYDQKR
ncbi:MAG TPA: hypothetical protein P5294_03510 [Smithellaceae bacterium]|nr:hypothetical protein [Smithellaceae bacterium]HRS88965.1 hypothetical protein [Smithellaceae bacterium]HRV25581.1 hypothetical protein [Smithellaceae bacterium]